MGRSAKGDVVSGLKVGLSQVDYTPALGIPLMGNFRDDYGAKGVHDKLYARAIVFADSAGRKVALVSVDICMLSRDKVAMMREFIAARSDIEPESILIAATHTHAGPAALKFGSLPKADDASIKEFLKKAATAVIVANKNLVDSKLAVGYAEEGRVSFNRRVRCKDGQTHMTWESLDPDFVVEALGPIDAQMTTLSVEQQGRARGALVNIGLHPAILAGDNWLYSADYPGYLAEAMSKICGSDFVTLFFNGCCGDVTHIDIKDKMQGRGYQMTQRIGYMTGVAAFEAIRKQVAVAGDKIAVSREMVNLEWLGITEQQRQWSEEVLEKAKTNPASGTVDGMPDEFYAEIWLDMYKKQNTDDQVEVMAVRIGDVGIVGLPGELFCELGLEIKKRSCAKHTIVIELANDAIGYFPTKEGFQHGGYEATTGTTKYEKGAGEKLAASAIEQLSKLFEV